MKIIKIIIYSIIILALSFALAVLSYFYYAVNVPHTQNQGLATVFIEPGEKRVEIAQKLQEQGLIRDWRIFTFYSYIKQSLIQTGKFRLSPSYNMVKTVDILTSATRQETKVTIIEGWSHWQIAKELSVKGLGDQNQLEALLKAKEGYFFPDTYRFAEDSTPDELLMIMENNFTRRTKELSLTHDDIVIASLLEREGKTLDEKKKITQVIKNRLKINMTLDLDATIQYALGSWKMIGRADIQNTFSPYNTYKNAGLPPGPICNPGLDSMQAALNPTAHDFFYYFHARDGQIVFSKTLSEHNANIAKYGVSGS